MSKTRDLLVIYFEGLSPSLALKTTFSKQLYNPEILKQKYISFGTKLSLLFTVSQSCCFSGYFIFTNLNATHYSLSKSEPGWVMARFWLGTLNLTTFFSKINTNSANKHRQILLPWPFTIWGFIVVLWVTWKLKQRQYLSSLRRSMSQSCCVNK